MMDFFVNSILIPIIITISVATPASIYAGIIAARFVLFGEIKNKCNEIIFLNSGYYHCTSDVVRARKNLEALYNVILRLENLGYLTFAGKLSDIYSTINSELSEIETEFMYSEVRGKTSPTKHSINVTVHLDEIINIKPEIFVLLKLSLNSH